MGLFGAHLFGNRRSCHEETDHQHRPKDQHPVPLSPNATPINVLFTITFTVELLGELRTWLTYPSRRPPALCETRLCSCSNLAATNRFSGSCCSARPKLPAMMGEIPTGSANCNALKAGGIAKSGREVYAA